MRDRPRARRGPGSGVEKTGGQHRVEQAGPARQALGQQRRLGHDVGDQRNSPGLAWNSEKSCTPAGSRDRNWSKRQQRRVGRGGAAEHAQQLGDELGQDLARPRAARRAHAAVMPVAHHAGDRAGSAKPSCASVASVSGSSSVPVKTRLPRAGEARRLLEQLGIMSLDRRKVRDAARRRKTAVSRVAEKGREPGDAALRRSAGGASARRPPSAAGARPGAGSGNRSISVVAARGVDAAGGGERAQRLAGRADAQRAHAAAPDQLLRLGEELDLADAAAADLDVVPVDRDSPAALDAPGSGA